MIRITNNMLVNDLMRNLNNNYRMMDKYQRQLATGRKLNMPSDNPAGLVKSLRLRTNIVENEQYLANINEAINFMETTDSALDNITQILHRVRELTVKAANGTNDPGAHQAIADEVKELNEQIKLIANTTYGTKHVFGGRNVTEPPCQGNSWQGNDEYLELEIGVGITIPINITNRDMNYFFTDHNGKEGIFTLLDNLVNDIRDGKLSQISAALSKIDDKMGDMLTARSVIGAKTNRLELQKSRLESTGISFTGLLAANEDADLAEVIMQLKMQENVYRASLAAGARIIQPSLVDFLR
ncbi:flagellar hook-associated protein 3 FlgL [Thermosyntropha lipolytica DSM 11003]|uniref:Flagellar hook-associated protein 3 FlgL n=1 Tax=Thermosyntropha lipolytica DSM 11003 TaxID=1123382 RepID=A0A1M5KNF7_9FIRM|nr:flagellar hook-associated protein FlgL [Thermosyntropha lipolytica]SHG54342.1 flagellar hook-associated protein 3 FlgL [Thermosyntropha lipolytica DSM 11003]